MVSEHDPAEARKRHQLLTWQKMQLRKVALTVAARGDVRLIRSPKDLDVELPEDGDSTAMDDVDDLPVDAGL